MHNGSKLAEPMLRMNDMSKPLPEFDNPPVVEVALSVQFEALATLRTPQIGLLWQEFRDRFHNRGHRRSTPWNVSAFHHPKGCRPVPNITALPSALLVLESARNRANPSSAGPLHPQLAQSRR
jgi:hypothetical protein